MAMLYLYKVINGLAVFKMQVKRFWHYIAIFMVKWHYYGKKLFFIFFKPMTFFWKKYYYQYDVVNVPNGSNQDYVVPMELEHPYIQPHINLDFYNSYEQLMENCSKK